MEKRRVPISKSGPYLSAWGNENIIKNYVAYFEKKMKIEIGKLQKMELDISSVNCPNFAAWIRFYTEMICNSLYWKTLRYNGNWEEVSKKGFGELKTRIIKKLKQELIPSSPGITDTDIERMNESICLILNLRHSFLDHVKICSQFYSHHKLLNSPPELPKGCLWLLMPKRFYRALYNSSLRSSPLSIRSDSRLRVAGRSPDSEKLQRLDYDA